MSINDQLEPTLVSLWIDHHSIETLPVVEIDPNTGKRLTKYYVYGSLNGKPFQVPCDEQVEVSPEIAELLLRLIQK